MYTFSDLPAEVACGTLARYHSRLLSVLPLQRRVAEMVSAQGAPVSGASDKGRSHGKRNEN